MSFFPKFTNILIYSNFPYYETSSVLHHSSNLFLKYFAMLPLFSLPFHICLPQRPAQYCLSICQCECVCVSASVGSIQSHLSTIIKLGKWKIFQIFRKISIICQTFYRNKRKKNGFSNKIYRLFRLYFCKK